MTAIGEKTTQSVAKERSGQRIGTYFAVGLAAVALGVGAVWAAVSISGTDQSAAVVQGRVEAGLAQQAAMDDYAQLQGRFEAGLAQQAAVDDYAQLQGRFEAGLAQQAAMSQRQGRIDAGRVQAGAIDSRATFQSAWKMRGEEMGNHVDSLVSSGLAQQAAIDES